MKRLIILCGSAAQLLIRCIVLFLCSNVSANAQTAIQRPNIIFIMADDLGYGDVGFNGQDKIKTPNIDRLAAEGMVFSRHYAGTAVCGPSRAALLTGIHTAHANVRELSAWTASGNPIGLQAEEVTVAEELKRAGYRTAVIGKWGLEEGTGEGHPLDQGFDYFYGYLTHMEAHHYYPPYIWENREKVELPQNRTAEKIGEYSNDAFTRKALDYVIANRETPFFLYLPYTVPHNEITVPEDAKMPYLNLGWPKRPMKQGHYYHDPEGNVTYAGMVSRLDTYVGQLMDRLREQGLEENTLIIFTSDNGPGYDDGFFNSNGGFRGKKLTLYEGGLRMPFAAKWPAVIKPGRSTSEPVAFWDFLPTVCDIVGLRPSVHVDGVSYFPLLEGAATLPAPHPTFYWEVNETRGPIQAVLMGEWKGIKQYQKPFELYNIKQDPNETQNLAASHPDIVKQIETYLSETRTEHPEFPLTKREAHYDK
ncbi:arylsulfatase [Parapedobacter indicus]|uniref:Arylsulfatase A n=1 Tax=Parapedobacter indicus TaxID=1477437 RepID=A0A1I3H4N2_9SPHI|nr:arylsulfatase [Parapedobacter indicus]PPL02897.1 arylsulfatase A-like enzyme [Parapedobacter indicus]SFI30725.1 Arylsulfatase A [Parapedobacter indicus]